MPLFYKDCTFPSTLSMSFEAFLVLGSISNYAAVFSH